MHCYIKDHLINTRNIDVSVVADSFVGSVGTITVETTFERFPLETKLASIYKFKA